MKPTYLYELQASFREGSYSIPGQCMWDFWKVEVAEVSLRVIRVFPDSVIGAMLHTYSPILILLWLEEKVFEAWSPATKAVLFPISGKH